MSTPAVIFIHENKDAYPVRNLLARVKILG
jgi:hypothetical protein